MQYRIEIAQTRPNHQLWLEYEDGVAGMVDFAPVIELGGVFESLADPMDFEHLQIGEGGRYIEWPGDIDFCADALRKKLMKESRTSDRR